jgi:pyridoxamine 5'-phosphate oxidase
VVPSRSVLDASYAEVEERFAGVEVPSPPHWGGYVVAPARVEFWQGRRSRMHDRLEYRRDGARWVTERLAP